MPDPAIASLADDYFAAYLDQNPSDAHLIGRTEFAGRFEHCSREADDHRVAVLRDLLARLDAVDGAGLDHQDRLTRDVLRSDAVRTIDLVEARLAELDVDSVSGLQLMLAVYAGMWGIPDAGVAAAMVDKVAGMGTFFAELAERQREGLRAGRVAPAFAVAGVIEQVEALVATPAADNPAIATLKAPEGVDEAAWRADLARAVTDHLVPRLTEYLTVLREVQPEARPDDRVGLRFVPSGDDAYAAALRYFTTTTKSAEEIHQLGLDTVAALADEYRALGPDVVGTDDIDEIFRLLRDDPALHHTDADAVVRESEEAMARAWEAMPAWFETLPEAPCAVAGTPSGPKGFYFPPATDGSRGGTFFLNVSDPSSWGTFELESVAFHEGIPGHHLQIAVASELPADVPDVRRHLRSSAYSEGWGLYTERLADEMGLYSSPLARMGMLATDSMRACRLVVDTGLHAFGWPREKAVRYMLDNSPLSEGVVRPEVDRYILSPGQATSYMVGRAEIDRMRREAEERQGDAFDVRRFHTAVLGQGALPLDVLDREVAAVLP